MINLLNDLTSIGIRAFVGEEREAAKKDAECDYKVVRSRGTFLCTSNFAGAQCEPSAEATCPKWSGNISEVRDLLAVVERFYPEVAEIYISGGYDGADSLTDMFEGKYDPWVSNWHLTVWERK